ncbi:MAG: hypothetical protein MJ149_01600 [Clostridia bacterium]|nr:hypothetical protein [Clostridia bacterium]
MKYFGTDGIRGKAEQLFTPRFLTKIAYGIVRFYKHKNFEKRILIGNDSRSSSGYIESVLCSVLCKFGFDVHHLGMCSSPCLAFVGKKWGFPLSVMISASHNSKEYNGIKFFNKLGTKITEAEEEILETFVDKPPLKQSADFKNPIDCKNWKADYVNMLKNLLSATPNCIIDGANGGASEIIKQVFAKTKLVNVQANGNNINENAGCTHIEKLCQMCRQNKMVGFAVDGDADRILVVDEFGNIVDGDKILYILAKHYLHAGDTVVGTTNSNSGLKNALKKLKIDFLRCAVGDKNIVTAMQNNCYPLGGEESGHIILKRYTNTGDGVLTGIILLNILSSTKQSLATLLAEYKEFYIVKDNLKLNKKFEMTKELNALVDYFETQGARIVIRPSGTEPVLRVLVEHKDKEKAEFFLKNLKENIVL